MKSPCLTIHPRGFLIGVLAASTSFAIPVALVAHYAASTNPILALVLLIPYVLVTLLFMYFMTDEFCGMRLALSQAAVVSTGFALGEEITKIPFLKPSDGATMSGLLVSFLASYIMYLVITIGATIVVCAYRLVVFGPSLPYRVGICGKCGYDLSGSQSMALCPECGSMPDRLTPLATTLARLGRPRLLRCIYLCVVFVAILNSYILVHASSVPPDLAPGAGQWGRRAWILGGTPTPYWIMLPGTFQEFTIKDTTWSVILAIPQAPETAGVTGMVAQAYVATVSNQMGTRNSVAPSDPVIFCNLDAKQLDIIKSKGVPHVTCL